MPTKVKYGKVSGLIQPVFDILGILPGYRESDISLWFFLFFTLFFAMIIGDAGYGMLILIGTIVFAVKTKGEKKYSNIVYLLFVLSIATVIWGAITGTWFGMESDVTYLKKAYKPFSDAFFLQAFIIPEIDEAESFTPFTVIDGEGLNREYAQQFRWRLVV